MPSIGAQMRNAPVAHRARPTVTMSVTIALTGDAAGAAPSGTSASISKAIGTIVTAMSAMTVPATVGVMMRLSSASRAASPNWIREEITISVASIAGPPWVRAVTHTAMNAPDVPMMSMWPAPIRPKRTACAIVLIPLMTSAANTAQIR